MDLFTHAVLGSAVGGLLASRKIGNKAYLWGALCGLIPDIDVVFMSFIESSKSVLFHRGITHSILFLLIASPVFASLIHKYAKNPEMKLKNWTVFVFATIVSHLVLDLFTTYGTGLLEPFSDKRFALSSIAVVDLFFTLPILLIVILGMRKKKRKYKELFSWVAIIVTGLYLSFTLLNKLYIQSKFEQNLVDKAYGYTYSEAYPTIGSNFLWNCVASNDNEFYTQYLSNTGEYNTTIDTVLRGTDLVQHIQSEKLHNLQHFSKGHYSVKLNSDSVLEFRDMRFGKMGSKKNAPYVFTFKLYTQNNNDIRVEKIRPDITSLFKEE